MSRACMPDLRRENYFSKSLLHLSDEERRRLWHVESYHEAKRELSKQTVIPALSLQECAEELQAMGISVEQIDVVPLGIQSAWEGEIIGQYPPAGETVDSNTRVRLFVSHPSLSDRLPEGYIATSSKRGEGEVSTVEEWSPEVHRERLEVARREEPPAMRLFRVLESAMWRARIELLRLVGLFDGVGEDLPLAERLIRWLRGRPGALQGDRLRWLGNALWILGRSTGPEFSAAYLLEGLLGAPVSMKLGTAAPQPLAERDITRLGSESCRLGAGAILGECLDDRSQDVALQIGPLSPEDAFERFRSSESRRTQEIWAKALLPVSRPWKIRYLVDKTEEGSTLGAKEPSSILGVTAWLRAAAAES